MKYRLILILVTISLGLGFIQLQAKSFVDPIPDPRIIKPVSKAIANLVPFTPQAPLAHWSDKRQADGCEEASILMAMMWARDYSLTAQEAENEIINIANWQIENYDSSVDTSTYDAATRIVDGYFGYSDYQVLDNVSKEDIIDLMRAGNLIVAPMNGAALKNPYFSSPPPEKHMLLLIGYNETADYFIVHEPGTKRGAYYKYDGELIYSAIKNYPTTGQTSVFSEKSVIAIAKNR